MPSASRRMALSFLDRSDKRRAIPGDSAAVPVFSLSSAVRPGKWSGFFASYLAAVARNSPGTYTSAAIGQLLFVSPCLRWATVEESPIVASVFGNLPHFYARDFIQFGVYRVLGGSARLRRAAPIGAPALRTPWARRQTERA